MLEETKNFNAILTEAYDNFQSSGVSIIGEGFKEVISNPSLLESYIEMLAEGTSANNAAAMTQLMHNTGSHILHESSMTGIQPIASLSMPVIRKLWPKFALKEAIKTEVAKSPRFVVSYTKPYMQKGDNAKVYLPKGLKDSELGDNLTDAGKKTYVAFTGTVATGAALLIDKSADAAITLSTTSAATKQPCDELIVTSITKFLPSATGATLTAGKIDDGLFTDITAAAYKSWNGLPAYSVANGVYTAVSGDIADLTASTGDNPGAAYFAPAISEKVYNTRLGVNNNSIMNLSEGQLILQLDPAGKVTAAFVGATAGTAVVLSGKIGVSTEYNEDSYSVGFDIARQDISIPTGKHINAPLPVEALNDMMALYQIDGTRETVDIMTNIFAQRLDLEVLDFLENSFLNQPSNEAFSTNDGYSEFATTFDCRPAAGFAGSPKAWREELKPLIDFMATKIKNATYLQSGMFTIVGNPVDINLITNVEWSFRAGQGNSVDGVDVDYSVGSYSGANIYRIISSVNVTEGAIYIVFTPSAETQMTYKYYPYTFSTEMGYIDPNRSRVPSIMMTKRHTFQEFLPALACITISNNGNPYNSYVPTKAIV